MAGCLNHGLCGLNDGAEYGLLRRVKPQRCGERVLFSDSRGLVDGLVGNVGVEFLGEVIVFALHLISEVVDAVIDIRIHFAEPGVHIGIQIIYPLIESVDSLIESVDSLVQIADSIVHVADSIVHIADSIVHIAESLALNGYHVIKNGRESHGEANNERYELRVCHGGLLLSTMLPQLYAAFAGLSSGKSV